VIARGCGAEEYRCVAARAEDGSFVIAYAPRGQPLSIHMNQLAGTKVKTRWYDPREGSWHDLGDFANTGTREFPAPSQGLTDDWVWCSTGCRERGSKEKGRHHGAPTNTWV
jgi:hypothetical protein